MKPRWIELVAILLCAMLLPAGCGRSDQPAVDVPDRARAGDLTLLEACQYQPPGSKAKYDAQCATLTVPENWQDPAAPLIALPVVRIAATSPNPAEPVLVLWVGRAHPTCSLGHPTGSSRTTTSSR